MRRFYCHCGNEVYFENTCCSDCDAVLGFAPSSQQLISIIPEGGLWRAQNGDQQCYRLCEHRSHQMACNWLIPAHSTQDQCDACRRTNLIPDQSIDNNIRRWSVLESAKRRMFYGLLRLKLPISEDGITGNPLQFNFLEDKRSNPNVRDEFILSGHGKGVITLNAAEADSSYREATREAMNEPYRTLLGHFRHEIGHFYWDQLVANSNSYAGFRDLFGDDTLPYSEALDAYYATGVEDDWQDHFISAYSSSHPLEDWAETWAHYLLMHETMETALAYELISPPTTDMTRFDGWMAEWMKLVVVLNAISRSIGNADAYPFVISSHVREKLHFVHEVISSQSL